MTLPSGFPVDDVYQELMQLLATACAQSPAVLLETENRTLVDLASPQAVKPFVQAELKWGGGAAVSLGENPIGRQFGLLVVLIKVKCGAGTLASLALAKRLAAALERHSGAYVETDVAHLLDGFERQGWYCLPLQISFYADSTRA